MPHEIWQAVPPALQVRLAGHAAEVAPQVPVPLQVCVASVEPVQLFAPQLVAAGG